MKTGRNDPCPCGSGKKYKKCCMPLLASNLKVIDESRPHSFPIIDKPFQFIQRGQLMPSDQKQYDIGMKFIDIDSMSPAQKAAYYNGVCPNCGVKIKKANTHRHSQESV